MKDLKGPYTQPGWRGRVAANVFPPMLGSVSGEITANVTGTPLGAAKTSGTIKNVWFSLAGCGRDDSNAHSLALDVMINEVSCLTTKPAIAANNGSAAAQKTTVNALDTGVTQAVMASANSFSEGDVISYNLELTRTASPTTEMRNPCVVVEFDPAK